MRQRIRLSRMLAGALVLAVVVGCDVQPAPSVPRAKGPSPPVPPGQSQPGAQVGQAAGEQPQGGLPGVSSSEEAPPQYLAKLSVGTALPQMLPTGTAMGMSVDYVLHGPLPKTTVQTVWVIESGQGASVDVPVRLIDRGNLMTFVTDMKPEQGPFRSYLAIVLSDGRKVPISPSIDMKGL